MKRRYEVIRTEAMRDHIAVRVIVHEMGPIWSIDLKIAYIDIDGREIYEAWELENERLVAWERRQRERLDDSLF